MSDDLIRSRQLKPSNQQTNSGFALVIALSLMAFVLLLLLSITTLVQVETVNSAQTKDQLTARNNALLGMQIALGNLQIAAGPDQRITSNAAILDGVDPSKSNYTVVWDADGVTPGAVTAPLAWLASGEDKDATATSGSSETSSTWPMLVSERDSGTSKAVYAAPISLLSPTGSSNGQIAWWVGDEGVKAKFNLAESDYLRDPTTASDKRLGISARYGIEALEGFETAYDYTDDSEGDLFVSNLRKTISPRQGSILNSDLEDPLDNHFHDISFHSRGLLTNTRDGGLKEDLTHYFEGGSGGPLDTEAIYTGGTAAMDRITWGQLKSFYNLGYAVNTSDDSIIARAQEETQAGVYPILTILNLNYGFTMSSNYDGTDPALPEDRIYDVQLHIRPWFVLANPYNTKLTVSNYRIRIEADSPDARLGISYDHDNSWKTSSVAFFNFSYEDVLNNMIFVVPEVSLEPGEALYYCLKGSDDTDYGYTYVAASAAGYGGRYAPYSADDIAANTPRQFVFEAVNDGGQRSISVGNSEQITGDIIELGGTRIRRMYTQISDGGEYSLRTSVGSSETLLDDEKILQDIGIIRSDGNHSNIKDQGGWNIDDLPNDLFDPDKTEIGNNFYSRTNSPEVAATTFALNTAININNDNIDGDIWAYHDYDGWATDYNIRAPRMSRHRDTTNSDANKVFSKPTAYAVVDRQDGQKYSELKREAGLTSSIRPSFKWGPGYSREYTQAQNVILFDIPRLDDVTLQPSIASLGQLQHFNPGGWTENSLDTSISIDTDTELNTLGFTPSYAIGNSYAAPQVPRESTTEVDTATSNGPDTTFSDVSYLLNEALFDQYFFSTIPQDTSLEVEYDKLPNKRLVPIDDALDDATVRSTGTAAAENLFVDGAFNVNSSSVDAWYALLNSFRGFDFGGKTAGQGIFPRSLNQSQGFVEGTVDGMVDSSSQVGWEAWAGWRHLEDDESLALEDRKLYQLAEAIVEEVKIRGPFVSMSDFVNRRLVSKDDASKVKARTGLSGALQAALDRVFNNAFDTSYDVDTDYIDKWGEQGSKHIVDNEQVGSGIIYDTDGSTVIANATSASSMPGWVLQADLLQALAPALTVRSDTFTIRSYGNALDPLTGKVSAEAYVEAVVQRLPDYVEALQIEPDDLTTLSATNKLAGRRFAIVDIRFLNQSEL
jgi:hypothetical protein